MRPYEGVPPLRADPFTADAGDAKRIAWASKLWHSQDELLRQRDRQVEESIRMLAGKHWSVYNPWLQKFLDITEWMTDEEKRWRQRPVINRVLYWYILTHSRLTENPPIITFLPSTGDAEDAALAEVADTIFKTRWRDVGMQEVIDRLMAWMIPGGRAHLMSVFDPRKGPLVTYEQPAALSLVGPDGQPVMHPETGQPIQRSFDKVPFDAQGNPLAQLTQDGLQPILGPDGQPQQPHSEREGDLRVDVLSCLEVRGTWGPQPWHEKPTHMVRSFLSPEEIGDLFGVEVQADAAGGGQDDPGYLRRLLFGSGFFGAASARTGAELDARSESEGFVEVLSIWQRPCEFEGMEESQDSNGGRLTVVTKDRVLRDGARPFRFKSASSVRTFDFVNVMGRPSGTSPQEMLNPINRAANRMMANILEHGNLVSNPIALLDQHSGLQNAEFTNKPGARYTVTRRPGIPAMEWMPPPNLGRDVYNAYTQLFSELEKLGNVEGAEGTPPAADSSGKLVQELRYNSDRFLGSTSRRTVEELGRMADDWITIFGQVWNIEKVIEYAGEDTIPRTISVYPELFKEGKVHVVPDVESMLPESRSERISRVNQMYQMGAFGMPGSPPAVQKWLEMARFPHLARSAWPGGVHVTTAQQENGKMVRGQPADAIPIYEWYDSAVHLQVHDQFMASPDFLKFPPQVQEQFVIHRTLHVQALQAQQMQAAMQQAELQKILQPPEPDDAAGDKAEDKGEKGGEDAPDPREAQRKKAPAAA